MENEETNELTDADLIDPRVQAEYQRLLDDPDKLEQLINELQIPEDGMLTPEQVWEKAEQSSQDQSS